MMVQTNQSKRRSHETSQKVRASWSGPMPGSVKSGSGTSSPCHCSRTVTASRVAGTGQHLTRPDSENMPEPPDQVERPRDQPEQRKRKQWSCNLNKEVMYCYYKARRDQPRGYRKRMHQLWQERGNFECTEQRLCDQKKQIQDKTLLASAELEEVKAQVEEENIQEESTRPTSEEDHPTTVEAIIEPYNPEPEYPSLPEAAETTGEPEDNTDDYEQLKEEYLELLEDTKSQPMKNRKKLPKLKMNKNTKKLIRMVNKIIETASTDDMNITDINLMQFAGALLITNKETPAKPTTNRKPRNGPPVWQQRLQKQIDQLRSDLSIINEYITANTSKKIKWKFKIIWKKHKITKEEQITTLKEDLKQNLQTKAQRLRRYTKRSKQYRQNKMFREDAKRFYRELGKKIIKIQKPPDIGEVKKFWQNILEQEISHHEDAQWIKDQQEELKDINQMEWKDFTVEELRVNITRAGNWKSPGPDKLPNFWIKQFTSLHTPWQRHTHK